MPVDTLGGRLVKRTFLLVRFEMLICNRISVPKRACFTENYRVISFQSTLPSATPTPSLAQGGRVLSYFPDCLHLIYESRFYILYIKTHKNRRFNASCFYFILILILYRNIKFYQTHSERFFGKTTLISVPLPSWLSKVTVPPWYATARFTMLSPSPVPSILPEWLLSPL